MTVCMSSPNPLRNLVEIQRPEAILRHVKISIHIAKMSFNLKSTFFCFKIKSSL
jgi:hypothetical protein